MGFTLCDKFDWIELFRCALLVRNHYRFLPFPRGRVCYGPLRYVVGDTEVMALAENVTRPYLSLTIVRNRPSLSCCVV